MRIFKRTGSLTKLHRALGHFNLQVKICTGTFTILHHNLHHSNMPTKELGSDKKVKKTKTLIVKDLEGLRVVPPGLEPGTK